MLGKFENFPIFVHKTKTFKIDSPLISVQKKIIKSLYNLNGRELPSSRIFSGMGGGFSIIFEIGVADGANFNYLDETELDRYLNYLKNESFRVLDFFLVNRYYTTDDEKRRKPLKFDYQMMRLEFSNDKLIIKIYHERGPRRIQLEELIDFFASQFL